MGLANEGWYGWLKKRKAVVNINSTGQLRTLNQPESLKELNSQAVPDRYLDLFPFFFIFPELISEKNYRQLAPMNSAMETLSYPHSLFLLSNSMDWDPVAQSPPWVIEMFGWPFGPSRSTYEINQSANPVERTEEREGSRSQNRAFMRLLISIRYFIVQDGCSWKKRKEKSSGLKRIGCRNEEKPKLKIDFICLPSGPGSRNLSHFLEDELPRWREPDTPCLNLSLFQRKVWFIKPSIHSGLCVCKFAITYRDWRPRLVVCVCEFVNTGRRKAWVLHYCTWLHAGSIYS